MCLTCLRKNGIRAKKTFLTLIYEKKGAAPHGAAPSCVSFSNIYLVNLPL